MNAKRALPVLAAGAALLAGCAQSPPIYPPQRVIYYPAPDAARLAPARLAPGYAGSPAVNSFAAGNAHRKRSAAGTHTRGSRGAFVDLVVAVFAASGGLRRLVEDLPFSPLRQREPSMNETLPMSIADAESCLRLTVAALSNVLGVRDQEFLEQAMRTYAHLCMAEAARGKTAP